MGTWLYLGLFLLLIVYYLADLLLFFKLLSAGHTRSALILKGGFNVTWLVVFGVAIKKSMSDYYKKRKWEKIVTAGLCSCFLIVALVLSIDLFLDGIDGKKVCMEGMVTESMHRWKYASSKIVINGELLYPGRYIQEGGQYHVCFLPHSKYVVEIQPIG